MMPVTIRVIRTEEGVRVRIHYFVRSARGPIKNGVKQVATASGPMVLGGGHGFIACQPSLPRLGVFANGTYQPTPCTDYAGGVTCPECKASVEFQKAQNAEDDGIHGGATRNGVPLHGTAVRKG